MATRIEALGHYAPARVVTNAEIETGLGLEAGWIARRTGIVERRFAAAGEKLSDMAVAAAEMALAASRCDRSDVGLLLLATSTPDHLLPPSAPLVAHRLRLTCGGIDLAGACSGFLYALTLADAYVKSSGRRVLVIAANILSRRINPSERASAVLFADAAGALIVGPSNNAHHGLKSAHLASDGSGYSLISIAGGGSAKPFGDIDDPAQALMSIADGAAVYERAVAMMVSSSKAALREAGLAAADIDWFVPHQANARMMATVARQLGIEPHRTLSTVAHYANSSAATIPFTLSAAAPPGGYASGARILMTAAGAGLSGGAAVLVW